MEKVLSFPPDTKARTRIVDSRGELTSTEYWYTYIGTVEFTAVSSQIGVYVTWAWKCSAKSLYTAFMLPRITKSYDFISQNRSITIKKIMTRRSNQHGFCFCALRWRHVFKHTRFEIVRPLAVEAEAYLQLTKSLNNRTNAYVSHKKGQNEMTITKIFFFISLVSYLLWTEGRKRGNKVITARKEGFREMKKVAPDRLDFSPSLKCLNFGENRRKEGFFCKTISIFLDNVKAIFTFLENCVSNWCKLTD